MRRGSGREARGDAIHAISHLCLGGNEVSNGNRTTAYLRAGLAPGAISVNDACDCFLLDSDYYAFISPAVDPAPWYVASKPESAEFLGFIADRIDVAPVSARSVTPRSGGGAVIGAFVPKARLISVQGWMWASSPCGMEWGQRWLSDVLAGSCGGCAADTLEILPCCPDELDPDPERAFRTLYQVGIVDGPIFDENVNCVGQQVSFQLMAGIPYLFAPPELCMDSVVVDPEFEEGE